MHSRSVSGLDLDPEGLIGDVVELLELLCLAIL